MQVYVAIHDGHRTKALRIHLAKGTRSRLQEDDVASRLVHHFFSVQPSALSQQITQCCYITSMPPTMPCEELDTAGRHCSAGTSLEHHLQMNEGISSAYMGSAA